MLQLGQDETLFDTPHPLDVLGRQLCETEVDAARRVRQAFDPTGDRVSRVAIERGRAVLVGALRRGIAGRYLLQAATTGVPPPKPGWLP